MMQDRKKLQQLPSSIPNYGGAGWLAQANAARRSGASYGAMLDAHGYFPTGIGWDAYYYGQEVGMKSPSNQAGIWNAIQHAYWQAMLTSHYGEESAKAIGDAHEIGQNGIIDSRVDLFNNVVGREIGKSLPKNCTEMEGRKAVFKAMQDGRLILRQDDPRIPPPE